MTMNANADTKQKLIPVRVPWQVSPSTPFLRLQAAESESVARVYLVAHFGLEDRAVDAGVDGPAPCQLPTLQVPAIVYSPGFYAASQEEEIHSGAYRDIEIQFKGGHWARILPCHSHSEVIDDSAYDLSQITPWCDPKEATDRRLRRFQEQWLATGLCPVPGMYEVHDSLWLRETGTDPKEYRHYLIEGHDGYVEVIARGYHWCSRRELKGW